ncbi:MAG: epoxyqueuosine reductase QueH [Butyrivibrio sp.]|nr:epoxyqueuosine reductase QueH [Butyrivibrio sp.]
MNKINYQKSLDAIIEENAKNGTVPTLLLHSCCAPCSSYVLKYLSEYFRITLLYFNPNISPREEYIKRVGEQKRLINELPVRNAIGFAEGRYEPSEFYEAVRGYEKEPEGGKRCFICYRLRLRAAAAYAAKGGFDYFTTTLSVSPLKNAGKINEIGESVGAEFGVRHLPSDFKKKEGYKQSVELSRQYGLYRQNFCGCIYSKGGDTNDLRASQES